MKMVVNRNRENIKSVIDMDYTMFTENQIEEVVTGMNGNTNLNLIIKDFLISEITEWNKHNPEKDFLTNIDKVTLAYTADKLARGFIKHIFNGIDVQFGPSYLIVNKKELSDFTINLKSVHSESYKGILLRKLIVGKLDTFDLSNCMNEVYEMVKVTNKRSGSINLSGVAVPDKSALYGITEEN